MGHSWYLFSLCAELFEFHFVTMTNDYYNYDGFEPLGITSHLSCPCFQRKQL